MSKSQIWSELKSLGNPDGLRWRTPKAELLQSLTRARTAEEDEDFGLTALFEGNLLSVNYTADVILSGKPRIIRGSVRIYPGQDIKTVIENQLSKEMDDYGRKIEPDYKLSYEINQLPEVNSDFEELTMDAVVYTHHDNIVDSIQHEDDCALKSIYYSLQPAIKRQEIKDVNLYDIMGVVDRKYKTGENRLSVKEVKTICNHYNINLIIADATGKIIVDQLCPLYIKNGNRRGVLHFIAHMGHCYTIENKHKTKKRGKGNSYHYKKNNVVKIRPYDAKTLTEAVDVALREESEFKPNYIYTTDESYDMCDIFDIMRERKILFSIKAEGERVHSLTHRGAKIIACPDLKICRRVCNTENIEFTGQSIGSIASLMFDKYKTTPHTSELSVNGREIFEDISTRPCSFGTGQPHDIAYDISKCYTNAMKSIDNYPVYTVFDEPEVFDGEIKLGFYYIHTNNLFPFRGNNWYSSRLIKYALSVNIDFKILYQYIPQYSTSNPFIKFIDRVVGYHPYASKKLINYFIGTLNRAPKETEEIIITNSFKEYVHYANSYKGARFTRYDDLFKVVKVTPAKVSTQTNKPIYSFIIDEGKIQVHKLARLVGGNLVGVKTDCVYIAGEHKQPPLGKDIGCYRIEENSEPPIYEDDYFIPHNYYDLPKSKPWINVNNPVGGHCIDGPAGTGKSYIINNMESKASRASFTNASARNINGRTLHSVFQMRVGDSECKISGEDIIIDEYSMIPESIYAVLLKKKLSYPECKIILAGDCRQIQFIPRDGLTRIKDTPRVIDTETFKFLCDYNLRTLTECKRADDIYFNACLNGDYKSISAPIDKRLKSVNITRTNKKRAELNKLVNEMYSRKAGILKTIENYDYNKGHKYPVTGRLSVCDGSRWISDSTNKKLGFIKNTFYDIKDGKLESEDGHKVDLENLRYFSLRWAMTVNKVQGATITRSFMIHEFDSMDKHAQYTAVTRGTRPGQFQILN